MWMVCHCAAKCMALMAFPTLLFVSHFYFYFFKYFWYSFSSMSLLSLHSLQYLFICSVYSAFSVHLISVQWPIWLFFIYYVLFFVLMFGVLKYRICMHCWRLLFTIIVVLVVVVDLPFRSHKLCIFFHKFCRSFRKIRKYEFQFFTRRFLLLLFCNRCCRHFFPTYRMEKSGYLQKWKLRGSDNGYTSINTYIIMYLRLHNIGSISKYNVTDFPYVNIFSVHSLFLLNILHYACIR